MHYNAKTGEFTGGLFITDEKRKTLEEGVASGRLRVIQHPSDEELAEVEVVKAQMRAEGVETDIWHDENGNPL